MIVVSDTSPITSLIQIGRIELLKRLYNQILIPEAVQVELLRMHPVLPEFISSRAAANSDEVRRLLVELDMGEAEAIVLAKDLQADRLLIDETAGRKIAIREGVPVIGLLGVLLEGKNRRYISSVREITAELETVAGFRGTTAVKEIIFREAGEA